MPRILVIDDMVGIRKTLEFMLKTLEYKVDVAEDGEEGIRKIQNGDYALIITDIMMPKKDGVEVIIEAKKKNQSLPVIAISGGGTHVTADDALVLAHKYADKVLKKPFTRSELEEVIDEALSLKTFKELQ